MLIGSLLLGGFYKKALFCFCFRFCVSFYYLKLKKLVLEDTRLTESHLDFVTCNYVEGNLVGDFILMS